MILAVETATSVCSVALLTPGGEQVERREEGRGVHSEKMFLFMEQLLSDYDVEPAELSEVLISSGPGQYTGLRIGASGIKGFLFGLELPLLTLGTLEGFAAGVYTAGKGREQGERTVHALIDARRNHLYHQQFVFEDGQMEAGMPALREIPEVEGLLNPGAAIVGTGLSRLPSFGKKEMEFFGTGYVSASNLISARGNPLFRDRFRKTDPEQFRPEYFSSGQMYKVPGKG